MNEKINSDNWATPSLMEAPYWRDGMSPIDYEIERNYWQQNLGKWLSGEYTPIWRQLAGGISGGKAAPDILTAESFAETLESGSDIIFAVGGKHYVIIGKLCMISERYALNEEKSFENPRQLIDNYMIDGLTLDQRLDEIEILYRT